MIPGTDDAASSVLVQRHDGVLTVTLNRPRVKNAMTWAGWANLSDVIRYVDPIEDRVVVVTGAGEDFCAGMNLALVCDFVVASSRARFSDSAVADLAGRLAAGPRLAMAGSKALLGGAFDVTLEQALDAEARTQTVSMSSPDVAEAIDAFLAKRSPDFRTGKESI